MATTQLYDLLGPRFPFGRGSEGNATISSDPTTKKTCTGTSGNNTLTISSGAYSNGDVVLIHQSGYLTSASEVNWEVNQIVSGGGTTTLTLKNNLARTYSNGAQVMDVKEYNNLTINSFTVSGWNYSTTLGGITAFAVRGTCTWNGTITIRGNNGGASFSDTGGRPGVAGGFRGGWNSMDGSHAQRGEGYPTTATEGETANGNGGGGGNPGGDTGGAGGGNASSGSNATQGSAKGGSAVGNSTLTSAIFGGGAGGGRNDGDQSAGGGGSGGGGIIAWIKILTLSSGGVDLRGGNGGTASSNATSCGGGGAGGFGLFNVLKATVSSGFYAGAGSSGGNGGGNGSVGRFRINYAQSVTGNTSPSASTSKDNNLRPAPAGAQVIV